MDDADFRNTLKVTINNMKDTDFMFEGRHGYIHKPEIQCPFCQSKSLRS